MQFPWQAATKLVGKTLGHYEILEPLGKGGNFSIHQQTIQGGLPSCNSDHALYPPLSFSSFW